MRSCAAGRAARRSTDSQTGATIRAVPRAVAPRKLKLQMRPDDAFRFAVVADTHSKPHPATQERLTELAPDVILHGGDIGELGVLDELGKVAPVLAVRGNIDAQVSDVPEVLLIELMRGDVMKLRLLLTHIAVYGPKLRSEVARLATSERASLVVCGHSHVPFIGRDRGLTLFNPGSIGPRRFQLPIVLGTIDVTPTSAKLTHIDCETGEVWLPPELPKAPRRATAGA
jgi:putative phosphoesterase